MKKSKLIGTKDFYHRVLMVAVPIMIQNGITNFVGMLDNIMVGQVGTDQMSGVAIVNQLMFVYNLMVFGGLAGIGIFTAQFAGKGDEKGLRYTMRIKIVMALVLTAGYQDADARSAAYETQKQQYLEKGKTEEEAASLAADIQPPAECNDHGTGYAADILSTDYPTRDTGFDTTRAYEWLTAYAAEYGFILRYPQDRQAATGVVFEPWHWRYVGVENALAIRASGLSLEEFLALQKAS